MLQDDEEWNLMKVALIQNTQEYLDLFENAHDVESRNEIVASIFYIGYLEGILIMLSKIEKIFAEDVCIPQEKDHESNDIRKLINERRVDLGLNPKYVILE